jgi:hypothetical protein
VPNIAVLPEEDDDSQSDDSGAPVVGELAALIHRIAAELGIHSDTVLSYVLQRAPQILNRSLVPIATLLAEPKAIAMCGGTADNLSELFRASKKIIAENRSLANAGAAPSGGQRRGAVSKAAMAKMVQAVADELADKVAEAARDGCVFRVHYGIHHFAAIARGDQAEILQSFASGTEPKTVGSYLRAPRAMSVAKLCDILRDLGSPKSEKRSEAQASISEMADSVAEDKAKAKKGDVVTYLEDKNETFPNITLTFSGYSLQEDGALVATIEKRLTDGLSVVQKKLEKEGVPLGKFDEKPVNDGPAYLSRQADTCNDLKRFANICAKKARRLSEA